MKFIAPMATPRITLRHLARTLGLSPTTVSRALNGYPEVNQTTRERVVAAARRLGYVPDRSASRLAHGVAGAFGIVFPSASERLIDPLFAEFVGGVADFAATVGIDITLHPVPVEDEVDAYRRAIAQRSVDGFILSTPFVEDPRIAVLNGLDVPFVVHGRTDVAKPYAWLDIDNHGGFAAAARLLASHGHRRVALVGGARGYTFTRDRIAGAAEGLAAGGGTLEPDLVFEGPMTEQMGYQVALKTLREARATRPSAFLCSSIFLALGLQRGAQELGLRIPDDLSLIAHDDRTPYLRAEYLAPALTATQSSIRQAGRRVAELLHQRIGGTSVARLQELWPVELVERDTVAPAS